MAEGNDQLNVLGLSTNSLLTVLIVIILLQCYGIIKCNNSKPTPEALAPWDTFHAKHQQERDDSGIGATSAGNSPMQKVYDAAQSEGLTGGYNPPTDGNDYMGEELPPKQPSDIERTENSLKHSLHGS